MRPVRTFLLAAAVTAVGALPVAAQEETGSDISVTAAVGRDVQERALIGEATSFPADVGAVFFHTTLEGDFEESDFEHVWVRDGEEVARVPMRARGPRWRTWSSKRIPPEWAGEWTVRIVDSAGNELAAVDFVVG